MGMNEISSSPSSLTAELNQPGLLSRPFKEIRDLSRRLAREFPAVSAGKTPLKIAVLSGFNIDFLSDYLRLFLFQRGFAAEIAAAGYGQLVQEVLFGGPALASGPDVVLMLPTHRDLRHPPGLGSSPEQAAGAAEAEASFWRDLIEKIGKPVVFLSFDQPDSRNLGELTGFSASGLGGHARRVNQSLFDSLPASAAMVDAEALNARLGPLWRDRHVYTLCKQPFAMEALPIVADTLAAAVAAQRGKARKVMVLDLDNTLWGGVVGDVGASGLELGPETPEGEAFTSFQRYAKALADRGVILALCSKNNQDIAWPAFTQHPAMTLKESDISAYTINFEDKATNIRSLAKTLNVGIDSLVFVDDNPIERAWVSQQIPEIAVVDLPENPALYIDALEAENHFPMSALTTEDLARTQSYRAIAVARQGQSAAADVDSFLKDLEPVAVIEKVDASSIDRITQLIGKTNQFKLNPALFDAAFIEANADHVVALRLKDRLQDYGIVAVAVTQPQAGELAILNWVMSCRVFSRRLEHAMVETLWSLAGRGGAGALSLNYVPSPKNGVVPDALRRVGFEAEGEDGRFVLRAHAPAECHHMRIQSN
jgi:FkbH-like protein